MSATSFRAEDDHQGSCDLSGGGGSDLVYSISLAEPSGLVIEAAGYDMVLYVTQGGCDAVHEVEDGCVDEIADTESLAFELLPAGDYNIVVDSWPLGAENGDAFTLNVEVHPGGFCFGDEFDIAPGNETPGTPVLAGADDLDTQDVDPGSEEPVVLDLVLCEGDVDYYLFGHMGGDLSLSLSGLGATGALTGEVFEASVTATLSFGELSYSDVAEGEKIADLPIAAGTELARGYYLLKVTGAGQPGLGDRYALAVTHECRPDFADEPGTTVDDNDLSRAGARLTDRPVEPIERSLCGDDEDSLLLEVRYGGDVQITFAGGAGFEVVVNEVVEQSGEDALAVFNGSLSQQTNGDDLILSLPEVPAETLLFVTATLPPGAALDPVAYEVDVLFGDPPRNETCEGALPLGASPGGAPTLGSTLNGRSASVGPCNGEQQALADGQPGTADVFYGFSLAQDLDTDIFFDGALDPERPERDFEGSVYLYLYPGFCPDELSGLTLVTLPSADEEPEPICGSGTDFRLRIPQLPAGDYLLVVDGVYDDFFGQVTRSSGRFEVSVQSYSDGFPPPQVCEQATEGALPAPGAAVTISVDTSLGGSELSSEDYACLDSGANGKERAVRLAPTESLVVDIETVFRPDAPTFDTMLVLRRDGCIAPGEVACDDDGGVGLASKLEGVTLEAGVDYWLFVEGFGQTAAGTVDVTITAAP